MIAEPQNNDAAPAALPERKRSPWRIIIALLLTGAALWFLSRDFDYDAVWAALRNASVWPIFVGLAIILATTAAKVTRWRWFFIGEPRPTWLACFWSLLLGQYANALLWRVGDLARIVDLNQRTGRSKAETLSTLVVEKAVELVLLAATIVVAIPFVVLPDLVRNPGNILILISFPAIGGLFVVAYRTDWIIGVTERIAERMPDPLQRRINQLAVGGLRGVAAMRSPRRVAMVVGITLGIGVLYVLTPLILFQAFGLPFGWREAVVLHLVLSVGSAPPSTPAKIGIFEWLTVLTLSQFGDVPESVLLSYAIIYHAVVVLPQILLGAVAASRSDWRRVKVFQ